MTAFYASGVENVSDSFLGDVGGSGRLDNRPSEANWDLVLGSVL
jgi:hypothetical protein